MELRGQIIGGAPLLVVAVHAEAMHLGDDLPILVTGVGKLASATAVLGALGPLAPADRPSVLWNLGTAGALRDHLEGVHVVGSVRQHDIDGPAIDALTGHNPAPILELGEGVALATGDTFVSDPDHRIHLAQVADICDMEGYAVAAAAHALSLEVLLVKHVSDRADEDARRSWVEGVENSSRILGEWLVDYRRN